MGFMSTGNSTKSITAHPLIHKFCGDSYIRLVYIIIIMYQTRAVATVFEIATFPLAKYSTRGLLKMGFSVFVKILLQKIFFW